MGIPFNNMTALEARAMGKSFALLNRDLFFMSENEQGFHVMVPSWVTDEAIIDKEHARLITQQCTTVDPNYDFKIGYHPCTDDMFTFDNSPELTPNGELYAQYLTKPMILAHAKQHPMYLDDCDKCQAIKSMGAS